MVLSFLVCFGLLLFASEEWMWWFRDFSYGSGLQGCAACYGLFSCFVFLLMQLLLFVLWTRMEPTNIHYSPRKLSTRSLNTSRMAALQPRQPVQIPLLLRPGKRPRRRSRCILVSCDLLLWFDGCPVTLLTRLRCDRRYEDA